jgi:hypothetical protein
MQTGEHDDKTILQGLRRSPVFKMNTQKEEENDRRQ